MDQSRQLDLQLQHPRPERTPSDEIRIDLPDMRSNDYWAGTESGLDIYNFPGIVYATDSSKGSTGMGACTDKIPKEADAARWGEALEEARLTGPNLRQHAWPSRTPSQTNNLSSSRIAVLTDSKGFITVSSNWVGEGKDPLLRHSSDGDIHAASSRFFTKG